MSVYYTDTIEITTVTYDAETNKPTEGATVEVKGYSESNSLIKQNSQSGSSDGNPVVYIDMVFFPIDVDIKKGYYVKLIKKLDIAVDEERRMVKRVNMEVALAGSQYEVEI